MYLSTVLLGFAAAVAAIDLRLYDNGNCGGGYLGWTNVQPNVCYAYDKDAHSSAEWRAIPTDWYINAGIYRNGGCKTWVASADVYNTNTRCISASGRVVTAARYHFVNKRSIRDSCDASAGLSEEVQQKCNQPAGPPSRAGLVDGTVYNIEGLDEGLMATLVTFVHNGSTAAEVPEVFQKLEIADVPSS